MNPIPLNSLPQRSFSWHALASLQNLGISLALVLVGAAVVVGALVGAAVVVVAFVVVGAFVGAAVVVAGHDEATPCEQ